MTRHSISATYERDITYSDAAWTLTAELEITVNYTAGCSDYFDRSFGNWLPGDPDEIEVVDVRMLMGSALVPAPSYLWAWAEEYVRDDLNGRISDRIQIDLEPDPDDARDRERDDAEFFGRFAYADEEF